MQIKTFLKRAKRVWIVLVKQNLAYLSVSCMLAKKFSREWQDYPWLVVETFRFVPLSTIADLYSVEKTLVKKYHMPNGDVKTEVEDKKQWTASLTASHVLFELGNKDRIVGFLPEKWVVLFEDNEYTEVCDK